MRRNSHAIGCLRFRWERRDAGADHPDGAGKANFFLAQGFTPDAWQLFADALRSVAARCPVEKQVDSAHGTKYVVDGELKTPAGKSPIIRTVWIVDQGKENPRLVTAYPHEPGE